MDHRVLVACTVIAFAICCIDKSSGSVEEENLVRELFSKYNRLIRPVTHMNETVAVTFTLVLSLLINVHEKDQVMKTNVWLQFQWQDPQLAWDPANYGGIQSIRLPLEKIWTPDVVLINNADGKYTESYKCNAVVYSNGNLLLLPPSIFISTCDIKVHNFPFDEQICDMKFQSWTYNADEVMLGFDNGANESMVEMTSYKDQESGTWDVIQAPGFKSHYRKSPGEPRMVDITYRIILRRKTLFYTINLLIPTVLISFLSVLVFYLPTVAGEKVALSISILLTLNVFLLLVSKLLPPASDLPLIGKFLLFTFLMNLISIVVTVVTINLNFRSPKTHTMPTWIRKVFLVWLPVILLMRRPKRSRRLKLNLSEEERLQQQQRSNHRPNSFRSASSSANVPGESHELTDFRRGHQAGAGTSAAGGSAGAVPASFRETSDPFGDSRRGGEREDSDDVSLNSPDARLVTNSIATIVHYHQQNDAIQEVEDDWKFVALVVDRLLLFIFLIATTVGSCKILLSAETIFENVEDAKKRKYF